MEMHLHDLFWLCHFLFYPVCPKGPFFNKGELLELPSRTVTAPLGRFSSDKNGLEPDLFSKLQSVSKEMHIQLWIHMVDYVKTEFYIIDHANFWPPSPRGAEKIRN